MDLVDIDGPVFYVRTDGATVPLLDLDRTEAEHQAKPWDERGAADTRTVDVCTSCHQPHPCDARRLVAELRDLRSAFAELADFVKSPVPFGAYGTWRSLGTEEAAAEMDEWDRRRLAARRLIARTRRW